MHPEEGPCKDTSMRGRVCKPRRETPEETRPADRQTDLRLLASRTVRRQISVSLSHPASGTLLWQPEKTNTVLDLKEFSLQ